MSRLKVLVCSLLLAVTLTATSANADDRWPGSHNSGCVRSNGYPAMSGGYRQLVQPYGYYGHNNPGGRSEMVYDSVHGDYHTVPRGSSRQPLDSYRSGSEYSYDGRGFHENSGW